MYNKEGNYDETSITKMDSSSNQPVSALRKMRNLLLEVEYRNSKVKEDSHEDKYINKLSSNKPVNNTGGVFENNIYTTLHSSNAANSFPGIN